MFFVPKFKREFGICPYSKFWYILVSKL